MAPAFPFDQRYPQPVQGKASLEHLIMRPTAFDFVTSSLMAVMILLITLVGILALIWMLGSGDGQPPQSPPPVLVSSGGSSLGQEFEFEIPPAGEVSDLATTDLAAKLAGLESVSEQIADSSLAKQPGEGQGGGRGKSTGPDIGNDIVGEGQRWELTFRAANRRQYAEQLDHHGIELGAFGGGLQGIDYASQLGTRPLPRHLADPSQEERLYFSWLRPSPLAMYERQLLGEAGIVVSGRQILKFIPPELEIRLAQLELEYAQSRGISSLQSIAKTVFRSEQEGSAYRFVVTSQRYKRSRSSVVSRAPKN